jgi:broad specificity phosphatase PhoE
MTGDYLKRIITDFGYESVTIEASPWIRTLQTAAAIAKQMGVTKIHVNYHYSEKLSEDLFPHGNPVGSLLIDQLPATTIKDRFLHGVELDLARVKHTQSAIKFPESYHATKDRIHNSLESLEGHFSTGPGKVAHIVVTHGAHVKTFNKRYLKVAKTQVHNYIEFCGISAVTIKGSSIRLIKGGAARHIQDGSVFDTYVQNALKHNSGWEQQPQENDDDCEMQ